MSHQNENSSTPLRRSLQKHVTTSNSAGPNILKDNGGSFKQLSWRASKLGDGGVNFKEISSKRKYKYFLFVYICMYIQAFQQVLRTCHWGFFRCPLEGKEGGRARQNLIARFKSIYGGSMSGRFKVLSKNTCEGVHLIVKLLAISLQACKFTKIELLHSYFWKILARF